MIRSDPALHGRGCSALRNGLAWEQHWREQPFKDWSFLSYFVFAELVKPIV